MEGKPILMHTLETFHRWDEQAELVLVLPDSHRPYWEMLCREIGCLASHRVVSGGETRFHSVRNGLEHIRSELEESRGEALVAVHDGVRPIRFGGSDYGLLLRSGKIRSGHPSCSHGRFLAAL